MNTTRTDREIRQLQRQVTDLRQDLQRLKSDLMWQESRRRFNRDLVLMVITIWVMFAAMGALVVVAATKG